MSSHDQGSLAPVYRRKAGELPRIQSAKPGVAPRVPFPRHLHFQKTCFLLHDPEIFFIKDREDCHLADQKMGAESAIFISDIFKAMQTSCVGTRLTPMNFGFGWGLFL